MAEHQKIMEHLTVFSRWRQPPPPPPKKFYQQPALILTLVAMFVLGPVGVIYNTMSEELKKKVDNKTLQLMIEKDREALKRQGDALKEKGQKDEKQDAAIIENQKTLIILRQQQSTIKAPSSVQIKDSNITGPRATVSKKVTQRKPELTPAQFEKYLTLKPEIRAKYKKYLMSRGFDVSGLPD